MHDKLMKLMEKKKDGKELDPSYKKSKMQALCELQDAMKGVMGDNLKKVTVASSSQEGLEKGLDKAKEVVEKMPGEEMPESEEKMPEMEASEDQEDMPLDKIEEMIKKLEELKRSKMMS